PIFPAWPSALRTRGPTDLAAPSTCLRNCARLRELPDPCEIRSRAVVITAKTPRKRALNASAARDSERCHADAWWGQEPPAGARPACAPTSASSTTFPLASLSSASTREEPLHDRAALTSVLGRTSARPSPCR